MTINSDLYAYLVADADIIAESVQASIYNGAAPKSATLPYIVFNKVSGSREHAMTGPIGFVQSRFQLSSWAASTAKASSVANAIRLALDGYKGTMGSTQIRGTFLDNEVERSVSPSDGSDVHVHGVDLDFFIWYQEATS